MARLTPSLRCSVIIPTYNRRFLLDQTLKALTQQNFSEGFEVIVADDGSSDQSDRVVHAFRRKLNVRYYWQPDAGFRAAAARNLGLRHARGETIIFLDCGVIPHPSCVQSHVSTHDSHPSAAVVGYVYGLDIQHPSVTNCPPGAMDIMNIEQCRNSATSPERADVREPLYKFCQDELTRLGAPWLVFWTCNVSAKLRDLKRVGGFDEKFESWGGEDIELGYRLHHAGVSLKLIRSAMAVHYPHPNDVENNRKAALMNYRYISRKHGISIDDFLMGRVWVSLYGAGKGENIGI